MPADMPIEPEDVAQAGVGEADTREHLREIEERRRPDLAGVFAQLGQIRLGLRGLGLVADLALESR